MSRADFIETARQIGCSICNEAIWWRDECTWLGDAVQVRSGRYELKSQTLGGDLYGGTAGIGLFLAGLAEVCDEPRFADTASGAFRHAARWGNKLATAGRLGFYSGIAGIAWALSRTSRVPGHEQHHDSGIKLAQIVCLGTGKDSAWDIIEGSAGVAAVFPFFREFCRKQLWEDTIEAIEGSLVKRAAGFSGEDTATAEQPQLTGFGHGASGLALGLSATHRITNSRKSRQAIDTVLEFERREFSSEDGNWPDHRPRQAAKELESTGRFMNAWCNGAPGIGLCRIRLHEQFDAPESAAEARTAMQTTQASTTEYIERNQGNLSLCHGAAGNAEILYHAGVAMNEPAWKKVATDVAEHALERFGRHRSAWPCGIRNGGHTPGLMSGTSGIGRFFLRRAGCLNDSTELLIGPN